MLFDYRRPVRTAAEDIGNWYLSASPLPFPSPRTRSLRPPSARNHPTPPHSAHPRRRARQPVFEIICVIGVITNAGLIVFTMTVLNPLGWPLTLRMWIFFCFQWFMLGALVVIKLSVKDVPKSVTIQLARQNFYVSKVRRALFVTRRRPLSILI